MPAHPMSQQASLALPRHPGGWATAALVALTVLGAPAFAEGDKAGPESKPQIRHFTSGGKEVAVKCFASAARGEHPAVVVLHAVDGERVGMVGFGLGATVTLSAATGHDLKPAALVEFFGTLPQQPRPDLKKLPPLPVLHGEEDRVVPVEQADHQVGRLAVAKMTYKAEVYTGVGRVFSLDGKETQW